VIGCESVLFVNRSLLKCGQDRNVRFPPHRHDFVEIEFIAAGVGKQIVNGIAYPLAKGAISVLFPWHIHEITGDARQPLDVFKCQFPLEFF
jgi:hypothetical protein